MVALDDRLADEFIDVLVGGAMVDELNIEVFLVAVLAFEGEAVGDVFMNLAVGVVEVEGGELLELTDDGLDFGGGDVLGAILLAEVVAQVVDQEDFVGLAGEGFGSMVGVVLVFEEGDDGLFEFGFGEGVHGVSVGII